MLREAKNLLNTLKLWLYLFIPVAVLFFAFPPRNPISAQVIKKIQADLLAPGVSLVVFSPMDAFTSQFTISLLLAFLITLPIFLYRLMHFFSPALYGHEKSALFKAILPSSLLFALGGIFTYFYLAPSTMRVLYSYASGLGATSYITLGELISFVSGMVFFSGLLFLTPVFMVLATKMGLVEVSFWKTNWRYALLVFIVLGALITPDGSGITMGLLTVPLAGLYTAGYTVAKSTNQLINTNQLISNKKKNWALDD